MNVDNPAIKKLNIRNIFLAILIISNLLNIYADEKEKSYIIYNNNHDDKVARTIFILTLIVFLLIYLYLLLDDYKELLTNDDNIDLTKIKILGEFLIVIGVLCLLSFQIKDKNSLNNVFF